MPTPGTAQTLVTFLDLENDMARYSVDNEVDRGHIRLCAAKALLKWVWTGSVKVQGACVLPRHC